MMMKGYLLSLILFLYCGSVFGQTQGIVYENTYYEKVVLKMKQEHKLMLLDFWASWCGPCKIMANETFTDSVVGEYVNNRFLTMSIDVDSPKGRVLALKYDVNAIPTLIVVNEKGEELMREVRTFTPDEFVMRLSEVDENRPSQLYEMRCRFDNGDRDGEFVSDYLEQLKSVYMNRTKEKVYSDFFSGVKEKDYVLPNYWKIYTSDIKSMSNPKLDVLLENISRFDKSGRKQVDDFVLNMLQDIFTNEVCCSDSNTAVEYQKCQRIVEKFHKLKLKNEKDYPFIQFAQAYLNISDGSIGSACSILKKCIEKNDISSENFSSLFVLSKILRYGLKDFNSIQCNLLIEEMQDMLKIERIDEEIASILKSSITIYNGKIQYIKEDKEIEAEK